MNTIRVAELIALTENLAGHEQHQSVMRLVARLSQNEPGSLGDQLRAGLRLQDSPIPLLIGLTESLAQTSDEVSGWLAACELLFQGLQMQQSLLDDALSARAASFLIMSGLQAIEACTLPDRLKYQLTAHYGCMATELLSEDTLPLATLLAYAAEGLGYIEYEAGTWAELYHELFSLIGSALTDTDTSLPADKLENLLAQISRLIQARELEGLSQWFSILSPALRETFEAGQTQTTPDCPV